VPFLGKGHGLGESRIEMTSEAIHTRWVAHGDDINDVIEKSIPSLPKRSVLVIASKIFNFCENRLVAKADDIR
jgi:F420-0:gamma-glutamyl ligase